MAKVARGRAGPRSRSSGAALVAIGTPAVPEIRCDLPQRHRVRAPTAGAGGRRCTFRPPRSRHGPPRRLASGAGPTWCWPTRSPWPTACTDAIHRSSTAPSSLTRPAAQPPWPIGNGPVIGFVGRIEPRKGPLDLVHAAPAIQREVPGARVVMVGSDPFGSDPAYTQAVIGSSEIEHYPWSPPRPD